MHLVKGYYTAQLPVFPVSAKTVFTIGLLVGVNFTLAAVALFQLFFH